MRLGFRRKWAMEGTTGNEKDELRSLLDKAKAGDREAFKTVVSRYQKKVFLLAYSLLHNREDALDVVQETFMKLYQKFHIFESERNFQAWLLQMTKNLAIDYYRKHHLQRREREVGGTIERIDVPGEGSASPSSRVELGQAFSRCLEKLAVKQRMILVMKHYQGLQYQEIARVLDISVGTVKSLHFKAVRNMRKLLSPQLGIEP